eukprot:SAG22_NODE_301_length_12744_cov_19.648189_8_plen_99_part_00
MPATAAAVAAVIAASAAFDEGGRRRGLLVPDLCGKSKPQTGDGLRGDIQARIPQVRALAFTRTVQYGSAPVNSIVGRSTADSTTTSSLYSSIRRRGAV